MGLMENLKSKALQSKKKIVLPEGEEERVILAAAQILKENLADLVLIGDENEIRSRASELKADLSRAEIINPYTSSKKDEYANELYELRKHKGLTIEAAKELVLNDVYYGTMMLKLGEADGLVSGSVHTTAETIKPGLQIIKTTPGISIVSSFFIMISPNKELGDDGMLLFADCAINQYPTAEELANIAINTAKTASHLCDMDPRVAMLSFSTKGSSSHEMVDKVTKALSIVKENDPSLNVDGEMQLDAAIIPEVGVRKAPGSNVAGKANVLIFPNLDAGNIGYKLVERFGNAQAIGPICQGFAKPINDLSRGCSVDDIIQVVILTSIQAQNNE